MDNSFNPNIVRIFCCDCCNEGLQLHFDFEWDDSPNVYLNFLCDARHLHAITPWQAFKHKWQMFWAIMRGKDFCLHDIILDRDEWFEFYEKMTEFNDKIKETTIQ